MIFLCFFLLFPIFSSSENQTKIGIHPNKIKGNIIQTLWCNNFSNSAVFFILTDHGTSYRSKDYGKTYENYQEKLIKPFEIVSDVKPNQLFIKSIEKNPIDETFLFFIGIDSISWVIESCGDELTPINTNGPISELKFHPIEKNWVLFSIPQNCQNELNEDFLCQKLYLSKKKGLTIRFLKEKVIDFSWGIEDLSYLENIPITRIYACIYTGIQSPDKNKWSTSIDFFASDDFFKNENLLLNSGNRFLLLDKNLFVVQAQNEKTQEVKLYMSKAIGKPLKFKLLEIPVTHLSQSTYTILESTKNSIFLQINHLSTKSPFGHIYVLNKIGEQISLSLLNNLRNSEGHADFEKIAGMSSVYLANVLEHEKARMIEREYSKNKAFQTIPERNFLIEAQKYIKTYITFDNGGIWHTITPPDPSICKKECSLNLNVRTFKEYGPIYSKDNSLGLVIATGNIGEYLQQRKDEINTYLSRDGGYSWEEIAKGSHIYEFGDHGGLILMAENTKLVKTLKYTWNYGENWTEIQLGDELNVLNILTEENNKGLHFIILAEKFIDDKKKIMTYALDFAELNIRKCIGYADLNSDYEIWTPFHSHKCLLGEKKTYIKRKHDRICYNGFEFEKKMKKETCECSEEDWECDSGFYREKEGGCQKISDKKEDYFEDCQDFIEVSSGYRMVPGSKCIGGLQYKSNIIECPKKVKENSSRFIEYIIGLVFIFCLILLVFVLLMRKKINLEDKIAKENDYDLIEEGVGNWVGSLENMLEENKPNEGDLEQENIENINDIKQEENKFLKY